MAGMPGGRAGISEAQPISCHIEEALVDGELVSMTQFGILEDVLVNVIPLLLLLLTLPLPTIFCTLLLGRVTNCAVARLPSAVFTCTVDPPSETKLYGDVPGIK